jgi:hypothetical protein
MGKLRARVSKGMYTRKGRESAFDFGLVLGLVLVLYLGLGSGDSFLI